MIYEKLIFLSGNENKREEFSQMIENLHCQVPKKDIPEIESKDEILVTAYKLKDMLNSIKLDSSAVYFIEDTSLQIEGADIGTGVKHVLDNLPDFGGNRAKWIVTLAVSNGIKIDFYQGVVEGSLAYRPFGKNGFGFDQHFIPDKQMKLGTNFTLAEIPKNEKYKYSARFEAVKNFNKGNILKSINISDLKDWNGDYQKED